MSCDDIVTEAELSTMLGRELVRTDGVDVFADAARLQAGLLRCTWTPVDNGDWRYNLGFWVLPSAADEFAASGRATEGTECVSQQGTDMSCHIEVLVREYWISAALSQPPSADSTTTYADAAAAAWPAIVERIVTAVSESGAPNPVWAAPDSGFSLAYCAGLPRDRGDGGPVLHPSRVAEQRVTRGCVTGDDWSVELLPGGAWAMPIVQARPPLSGHHGPWSPTTVTGTDSALVALGDGSTMMVAVGPDLLSVSALMPEGFEAAAAAKIAEILAAG